jgi:hypothetical protein
MLVLHRLWLRRFPATYDLTTSARWGAFPITLAIAARLGSICLNVGDGDWGGNRPLQQIGRDAWEDSCCPVWGCVAAEPRRLAAEPQVIVEMTVLVETLSRIVLAIFPGRSLRARAATTVAPRVGRRPDGSGGSE